MATLPRGGFGQVEIAGRKIAARFDKDGFDTSEGRYDYGPELPAESLIERRIYFKPNEGGGCIYYASEITIWFPAD